MEKKAGGVGEAHGGGEWLPFKAVKVISEGTKQWSSDGVCAPVVE